MDHNSNLFHTFSKVKVPVSVPCYRNYNCVLWQRESFPVISVEMKDSVNIQVIKWHLAEQGHQSLFSFAYQYIGISVK